MIHAGLVVGMVLCAFLAIQASRLLISALWLASCSAILAALIYMMGAPELAVIELSVGAGLVTVLFVFAIGIAGDTHLGHSRVIPIGLTVGFALIAVVLLGWMVLPGLQMGVEPAEGAPFSVVLWEQRGLDVMIQLALIFCGALGVLGLLADTLPNFGGDGETTRVVSTSGTHLPHTPAILIDAPRPSAEALEKEHV